MSTTLTHAGKYSFEEGGGAGEEEEFSQDVEEAERLPASRNSRKDKPKQVENKFDDFDQPKKIKRRKKKRRKPASKSSKKKSCMVYQKVMNGKSTTVVELIKKSRRPSSKSKCVTYKKRKNGKKITVIELVE